MMRLLFFNLDKIIPPNREIHTVIPAIIFSADKTVYSSETGTIPILMESDFLERNHNMTFAFFKTFYSLSMGEAEVNRTINILTRGFKLQHQKNKTKEELILIARGKKVYLQVLKMVYDYLKWSLEINYLEKINAYHKAGDITLTAITRSSTDEADTNERNTEVFLGVLTDKYDFLICTEHIHQQSAIAGINDSAISKDFFPNGIFKTDLFTLPGCVMMKRSKLPLLREELQPDLKSWQEELCKLQDDVREIDFTSDNIALLQQKANASFLPASGSMKKKIDDSIYFQQLVNAEFGEYKGIMSLGMSGRVYLLEALKNTGQMSHEVFNNLKEYFIKNNLADKTVIFLIHTVASYPDANKEIAGEQIESLWQASFE